MVLPLIFVRPGLKLGKISYNFLSLNDLGNFGVKKSLPITTIFDNRRPILGWNLREKYLPNPWICDALKLGKSEPKHILPSRALMVMNPIIQRKQSLIKQIQAARWGPFQPKKHHLSRLPPKNPIRKGFLTHQNRPWEQPPHRFNWQIRPLKITHDYAIHQIFVRNN